MTAHIFDLVARTAEPVAPVTYSDGYDDSRINHRLDVVASSVVEVVFAAGGWLYDRRAAGWEVNVFLPQVGDLRPLRILGVRSWDLDAAFTSRRLGSRGLAVSATAFTGDARVRETVHRALDNTLAELTLWGAGWPTPIEQTVRAARHRLSVAACAFKHHALTAAGVGHHPVGATECFLTDMRPCAALDSDLVPLAR